MSNSSKEALHMWKPQAEPHMKNVTKMMTPTPPTYAHEPNKTILKIPVRAFNATPSLVPKEKHVSAHC
jgi:hypothetical protein